MKTRNFLAVLGLTLASLSFSELAALAASRRSRRVAYRRPPPPPRPPPAPPKAPAPKTLQSSGTVQSINTVRQTLNTRDDNTKHLLRLIITSNTKFTQDGATILADSIKPNMHVSVSYQDTDYTLKEVKVTLPPGTAGAGGKSGKDKKAAKKK